MKMSRRFHSGFTLMEVLVTMGVLILITSIALPAYKRMKATARAGACATHLRQIGISLNLFANDNGTRLPEMVPARESKDQDVPALDTVLADYVSGDIYFHCPADTERIWAKTGTSYFWNSLLNDQRVGDLDFLGLTKQETGIPMVSDKENFHENVGDEVNILYADGHVQRELQFVVDHE